MMNSDSSEEEFTYPKRENRTARKSTAQAPPSAPVVSSYSTRQSARNASKALSASSFEKSMETFNPDLSQRERRKISKKFTSPAVKRPAGAIYNEKGRHVASEIDLCDCLNEKCPGCWFECLKCESTKCGVECRAFRKYLVDTIEYHGYDKSIQNPLSNKLN